MPNSIRLCRLSLFTFKTCKLMLSGLLLLGKLSAFYYIWGKVSPLPVFGKITYVILHACEKLFKHTVVKTMYWHQYNVFKFALYIMRNSNLFLNLLERDL
ncbi:hypothetical protein XENTR_v10002452 [Xenopus tropicalis]|nr:hypothetical protein XENTR_v10002452 [Xenopus tropicalis]